MTTETEVQPATDVPARRRGRARAMVAAGAVVLAGAGIAVYVLNRGDVPRGTTILGVDLGGMSRAEASSALHRRFDPRSAEPVALDLDGGAISIPPADIAMTLDVDATVTAATDGDEHPVIRLDQAKLDVALHKQIDPKRITLVHPSVRFDGLRPVPAYAKDGLDLDLAQAAGIVRNVWLTGKAGQVGLVDRPAAVPDEKVDEVVAGPATIAVAAPVTVSAAGKQFIISREVLAAALTFGGDELTPVIDGEKLHAAAEKQFAMVEVAPAEASISLDGGAPKIVASTAGNVVDLARLAQDLIAVLPAPAPRTVTAQWVTKDAGTTDADLSALGIKEKVSTFTTYFTGGAQSPRSQNIITIAKAVDGAVVKPGETFSLNGHTGERNYDAGYQDAPVIVDGKLEPGVGGGASQFTTTLFNAAYYAGLQDVEHKPHSFYFSRYPAVIESTIFYPTLDLKFKNTTPYGILIDTSATGKSVTVSMWSTKFYDSVTTERSPRRNVTSPPTVYRDPGPKCVASSGLPGFAQDAWRIIRKDGKEIKREKFTWRYDPEPHFVCGAKP